MRAFIIRNKPEDTRIGFFNQYFLFVTGEKTVGKSLFDHGQDIPETKASTAGHASRR